jgi:hypothetical protein
MKIGMIDTLIYSNDIDDYDVCCRDLLDKLEECKQDAKLNLRENSAEKVLIRIGDMEFEVLPNGKKGYAYILHNSFYELDLAQYRSKNMNFNPMMVKIKSEALWCRGAINAYKELQLWTEKNIGKIIENKITRIDLCCHIDNFKLNDNDIDKFKGQYYTDTIYRYRRKINAMTFGSSATGKLYCRIYDKVLEIKQKKQKTWFYQVWKNEGLKEDQVWNIEYQIMRDFLKERNISTVEETINYIPEIWKYCTEKFVVKHNNDNKNITRCTLATEWLEIQKTFEAVEYKEFIKREDQLKADAEAIVPSCYGYITTYAARSGIMNSDLVLEKIKKEGEKYLKEKGKGFKEMVVKKRSLIEVRV